MTALTGHVALVTGASRGVGRGVALGLAHAGATVYATGRTVGQAPPESGIVPVACDHTDDDAVARVFQRIDGERGRLDILVNVAWGGYERMVENGAFTWAAPFWQQPAWRWESMVTTGVRAAFVASQHAAQRMSAATARPDRPHLVVRRAEVRLQRDLRPRQGGYRSDGRGHGARAAAPRRHRRVALPGPGSHRERAGGRCVRLEQLREPGVHRPRRGGAGRRSRRRAAQRRRCSSRPRSAPNTDSPTWTASSRVPWSGDGRPGRCAATPIRKRAS